MLRSLIVSSSAASRLRAAREWLAALPRDAAGLILAAHPHAADELLRGDVAEHGPRFGMERSTLDRVAARLAAPELARREAAPASSLSLAAVAARAVHRLLEHDAAGRFTPIARRPGFPHAAVRTVEELRGAGIDPDALRRAVPSASDL